MNDNEKIRERATHHYNLGIRYEREGDTDAAVREFQRALKVSSTFPYPYKSLAEIEYRAGNLDAALEYISRALKNDPDWIEAAGIAGDICFDLGRNAEALKHLEKAHRGNPRNTQYISQLGRLYVADNKHSEAIELLTGAIRAGFTDYRFHFNLAVAYHKRAMEDIDRSIEHWNAAAKINSDDPKLMRNLGISCFSRGMLDEAAAAFRKALADNPGDAVAARFLKFAESVKSSE